jgi:hypothetical protein
MGFRAGCNWEFLIVANSPDRRQPRAASTGNWQLATGNWQLTTGNWQLATDNWQLTTDFY